MIIFVKYKIQTFALYSIRYAMLGQARACLSVVEMVIGRVFTEGGSQLNIRSHLPQILRYSVLGEAQVFKMGRIVVGLNVVKFEVSRGSEFVRFNLTSFIFICTYWAEKCIYLSFLSNISHLSPLRTNLFVLGFCTYWAVTANNLHAQPYRLTERRYVIYIVVFSPWIIRLRNRIY